MKADVITIFPGIALENRKWENAMYVPDDTAVVDAKIDSTRLISYSVFAQTGDHISQETKDVLDSVREQLIDADRNQIEDFAVLLDQDVTTEIYEPFRVGSHEVFLYLCCLIGLDHYTDFDSITIKAYKGGGHELYYNHKHLHWLPRQEVLYCMRRRQTETWRLRLRPDGELRVIEMLTSLHEWAPAKYKSMLNAFSLFSEACREERRHPNASVLLMASAFEALLQLPRQSKKQTLSYAMQLLWGLSGTIGKWAEDLYELRSKIVHGNVVDERALLVGKYGHYSHYGIARKLFPSSVEFLLESMGVVDITPISKREIIWKAHQYIIPNRDKVAKLLNRKSNFTYQNFVSKREVHKEFLDRMEFLNPEDSSASEESLALIPVVRAIASDWIAAEQKLFRERAAEGKSGYDYIVSQYEKLDTFICDYQPLDPSKEYTLEETVAWNARVFEFRDTVRSLGPARFGAREYDFSLQEFLQLSLDRLPWY